MPNFKTFECDSTTTVNLECRSGTVYSNFPVIHYSRKRKSILDEKQLVKRGLPHNSNTYYTVKSIPLI